jgi:basic amino acid/polyamine antiporter, APA family
MSFEYGLSSALNAVGFMHTLKVSLSEVGIDIPQVWISTDIYNNLLTVNPLATVMILVLMFLMLKGIKESIIVNNVLTMGIMIFYQYINLMSISIFDPLKAQPFFRNSYFGVMRGAAIAFFGYTSFE